MWIKCTHMIPKVQPNTISIYGNILKGQTALMEGSEDTSWE